MLGSPVRAVSSIALFETNVGPLSTNHRIQSAAKVKSTRKEAWPLVAFAPTLSIYSLSISSATVFFCPMS